MITKICLVRFIISCQSHVFSFDGFLIVTKRQMESLCKKIKTLHTTDPLHFEIQTCNPNDQEAYICIICHSIPINPTQTGCCGSIMCDSCMYQNENDENDENDESDEHVRPNKRKRRYSKCPLCRDTKTHHFFETDNCLTNDIDELEIMCVTKTCPWRGKIMDQEEHLNKMCDHAPIKCKNCSQIIVLKTLKYHIQNVCAYKFTAKPTCR